MKRIHRCICLALAFLLLSVQVFASAPIDTLAEASLVLRYAYDEVPIEGAVFDIYRLASVDKDGSFALVGAFADYPISIKEQTVEGWNDLAYTLKGYAQADDLAPTCTLISDGIGAAAEDGLEPGLYLVIGDKRTVGRVTYSVQPTIVSLPALEQDEWVYDVTIYPKASAEETPDDPELTVTRKVLKVWDDQENAEKRPEEIVIRLLCDGDDYDTVHLTEKNDWRYTWEELPKYGRDRTKLEWTVVEESVEGYSVKVEQEGITFLVTNTNPGIKPPVDPGGDLPKTGQLWWPVPMLICAGLLFLIVGVARRRRYEL